VGAVRFGQQALQRATRRRAPLAAVAAACLVAIVAADGATGSAGLSSAASTTAGQVYTWGQAVGGSLASSSVPVAFNLPAGISAVAVSQGTIGSFAVGSDGAIYSWGRNLGDGTPNNSATPVKVNLPGGVAAVDLAAGFQTTLALGADGDVYAWGNNDGGQIGNGTTVAALSPQKVGLPAGVTAVAISEGLFTSLAAGSDGNVYAWGNNGGKFGNGSSLNSNVPVQVSLPGGVAATDVAVGQDATLALGADGNVYSWGNNFSGQLGRTGTTNVPGQVSLPAGITATAISEGSATSLAVGSDGNVYAWGTSQTGQLGNGTNTGSAVPVKVSLPGGVAATDVAESTCDSFCETIFINSGASFAIGADGNLYAWGRNTLGQLGNSTTTDTNVPVLVSLPTGVRAVEASLNGEHSLALTTTGGGSGAVQFLSASPPLETLAGARYNALFRASGQTGYTLTGAAPWLSVTATGAVTGVPPAGTTSFSFSVVASNGAASATAGPFAVTVNAAAAVSGTVVGLDGTAVAGALVGDCAAVTGWECQSTVSAADGSFSLQAPVGGSVVLTAFPPQGSRLVATSTAALAVGAGGVSGVEIVMAGISPLPPGLLINGQSNPTVRSGTPANVTLSGCPYGVGTVTVIGQNRSTGAFAYKVVVLTETPAGSGNYAGTLPPLAPISGPMRVEGSVDCLPQSPLFPNTAPEAGGDTIEITGSGFNGATAVSFGGVPALSFIVKADDLIEAVVPPGTGIVPVVVTDKNGAAKPAGQFGYGGAKPPDVDPPPDNAAAQLARYVLAHPEVFRPLVRLPPIADAAVQTQTAGSLVDCLAAHGPLVLGTAAALITATALFVPEGVLAFLAAAPLDALGVSEVAAQAVANRVADFVARTFVTHLSEGVVDAYFGKCAKFNWSGLIDPSGTVIDTNGNPVSGATATILRSDSAAGPFSPVDPNSPGIAPALNPETTASDGAFHWDVAAGFYEVQATAPGCANPAGGTTATIGPYPVPPPQLGLTITLACPNQPPPPAPTLTSLSEPAGPVAGGTQMTIIGNGFTPSSTVSFGSSTATTSFLSPQALSAVAPPGAGAVDVVVHNGALSSTVSAGSRFFYGGPPTVSGLDTHQGTTAGGTQLAVTGTGFTGTTAVGFGGLPAPAFTVISDTQLRATAPAAAAGLVHVTVLNPAGANADSAANEFTFKTAQAIDFAPLTGKSFGDPDFGVSATAGSGLPVSFRAEGVCTLTGTIVHLAAAGDCTIIASQPGDQTFAAAADVIRIFAVAKAAQAITVTQAAPASANVSASFTVAATAPGGPVVFSSAGSCSNSGGTFTMAASAGACTVFFDQPGNGDFNPAPQLIEHATATGGGGGGGKAGQTISFPPIPTSRTLGDPDFTLSATASSGLPVSFAANGSCTVSDATVHISGAGACTVTASQAGNGSFDAAPSLAQGFQVAKENQTISFGPLENRTLGAPDFAVSATASSGLAVTFTANGSCSVSATTVHLTGAGTCALTAAQPGDANFNAAAAVTQRFTVTRQVVCTVPRVVGKPLAAARQTLASRHCRSGTLHRAFSRTAKKGVVIAQSRKAGRVLPANAKIDLVLSLGRKP
jgi:alpha-tubulin suppressor-like RCC1 family protein